MARYLQKPVLLITGVSAVKRLTNDLKRMLAGLAYQDAGDFLSLSDKLKALGLEPERRQQATRAKKSTASPPIRRRVALISDGQGGGAPLDYAMETCRRQGCQMDLLIHDAAAGSSGIEIERQIRAAGISCHRLTLQGNAVEGVIEYICNHPSLLFLAALPDDPVAKVFMEEVVPKHGGRLPVPLVLIEDRSAIRFRKQSAA